MISISIIMPSLNVAEYIEECLQSVINQTLHDIEIICIDAGSTDGTIEIIQEYAQKDARIKILYSDVKSYGYQMNMGIQAARGEYIGIVETDDAVLPEMYEKLYMHAKNNQVDFVKSNYMNYLSSCNNIKYLEVINPSTADVGDTVLHLEDCPHYRLADINHIWSAIYRKNFLIENQLWFNETPGASFQDTSFSILVGMMADSCIYVPDCYYQYRVDRPESSVKSEKKVFCVKDEMKYVDMYLRMKGFDEKQILIETSSVKIDVYWWNLLRLSKNARKEFREAIVNEINRIAQFHYEKKEQEWIVELILDEDRLEKFIKQKDVIKQHFLDVVYRADLYNGYVIIGAGKLFDKMLMFQEISGKHIIKGVCDNSHLIQGRCKGQYRIKGVEEMIDIARNEQWLILNQYHNKEILEQLLMNGIKAEKIDLITSIPEWIEVYQEM